MSGNESIRKTSKPIEKIKIGIYLLVGIYVSYAIIFGTTFFNEFERIMIFAVVLSGIIGFLFVWLGVELKAKHQRLE
jgi:hypothetical protein